MNLLNALREEVNHIASSMDMEPVRSLPTDIRVEDFDLFPGYRSGVLISGDDMAVSSKLDKGKLEAVIKREAFITFIPPEAERVIQVLDLAWAYSGAPASWWRECVSSPKYAAFKDYDPVGAFSLIPKNKRREVIRSLLVAVRTLSSEGKLEFPIFHYLLHKSVSLYFKPSKGERTVLKYVKSNPYASQKEIARATSLSPASVSRAINRLRRAGYLVGPFNVDFHSLGMVSLLVEFPNRRGFREAFLSFPFTYRIFETVSSNVSSHAFLLMPYESLKTIDDLRSRKVRVGQMVAQKFVLKMIPPKQPVESMMRAYVRGYEGDLGGLEYKRPRIRISKADLRILNTVISKGDIRGEDLSKEGIRSLKYRVNKLKLAGILKRFFTVGVPHPEDDLVVRIKSGEKEFRRIVETIGSVSTVIGTQTKGDLEGFFGVALPRGNVRGELVRGLRLIFRDSLEIAEDAIDYRGEWYIPIHLWDEDAQRFTWEEEFEKLLRNLELVSGRS